MDQIKEYIAARGYTCGEGLVENYYLSLLARPFVILTGMSDTDMTRLPELFAGAVGATAENGRYQCLRVEYDWMDSSDLFGHLDLWGKFVPGTILDFLVQARNDPAHPYFLCLDRLVLSRAEYYLREILEIAQTLSAGGEGEEMVPAVYYGRDREALQTYGVIPALKNLYITGTLALDETSFPLNQRLMDRIHTLQIEKDDLVYGGGKAVPQNLVYSNDFLQSGLRGLEQCGAYGEKVDSFIGVIEDLNKLLMQINAYVGYQVRNDIVLYLLNNHRIGVLPETAVLDHMICQKILVRAQGNAETVTPVLRQLENFCADYPKTRKKIAQMLGKCRLEGYTSYWV